MRVIGRTAAKALFGLEPAHAVRIHPGDQPLHLGHHLRPDAVARNEKKIVRRHFPFALASTLRGASAIGRWRHWQARLRRSSILCPGQASVCERRAWIPGFGASIMAGYRGPGSAPRLQRGLSGETVGGLRPLFSNHGLIAAAEEVGP